jgi:uncharacterized protein (DUF1015 family)
MATVKPFPGLRPKKEFAEKVASPPYDVLNTEEAREMAKGNPMSFLHVNKPEIDLPAGTDPYSDDVYETGHKNINKLIDDEILVADETPGFYLYAQTWGDHRQVGLVAGVSATEYLDDVIKKHEQTREKKEKDRIRHIEALEAQVGPVFLTYKADKEIDNIFETIQQKDPENDFVSPDGIRHTLWTIGSKKRIEKIVSLFGGIEALYVADGHHRSAAGTIVAQKRRAERPDYTGAEPWNYFLAVIFPDDQMKILPYNRVVMDLNGNSTEDFFKKVEEKFNITKVDGSFEPETTKVFAMYIDKTWYRLEAIEGSYDAAHAVSSLDAAILQDNLLSSILGIDDPRTNERVDFVGGIRGLGELEKRVDSGEMKVAFSMHATTIEQLMSVADAGMNMPPKSTWFEPKLRSGLIIHQIGK